MTTSLWKSVRSFLSLSLSFSRKNAKLYMTKATAKGRKLFYVAHINVTELSSNKLPKNTKLKKNLNIDLEKTPSHIRGFP